MSYRASIRPNVVVPFHRWTNCGPRQLHTKFGPNIRTTSIPAGPLLLLFSYFTIQNFKLQFDPPPFAVHSIKLIIDTTQFFSFWGWTIKCPRKPDTKFGPDIQRTCHAIRSLSLPVYNSTHHCAMSYRTSIRQKRGSPLSQVDYLWSKATAHQIWTKYSNNFYSGGTTFTHVLLFHYSKFQITIRPPPFAVHSIK